MKAITIVVVGAVVVTSAGMTNGQQQSHLQHPNQDLINLLMRGFCGDRFTGFCTERFACITRKYTDGLSGFVMTPDGELLAYFRKMGCIKSDECSPTNCSHVVYQEPM